MRCSDEGNIVRFQESAAGGVGYAEKWGENREQRGEGRGRICRSCQSDRSYFISSAEPPPAACSRWLAFDCCMRLAALATPNPTHNEASLVKGNRTLTAHWS